MSFLLDLLQPNCVKYILGNGGACIPPSAQFPHCRIPSEWIDNLFALRVSNDWQHDCAPDLSRQEVALMATIEALKTELETYNRNKDTAG